MEIDYNPYSPEIQADPYPLYRRLRDEAPVYHNPAMGFWALTRFDDVWNASLDWQTYSSSRGPTIEDLGSPLSIIAMDPPGHTPLRNLVSKAFTPRRIAELEPALRRIARDFLDRLAGRTRFDVVADFAAKFPLDVIAELVGVAPADRDALRHWFEISPNRDPRTGQVTVEAMAAIQAVRAFFLDLINKRRAWPENDLISVVTHGEFDDGGGARLLSDSEIIDFLFLVAGAGAETTTRLIAQGVWLLAAHLDQRDLLSHDPQRIPAAIEEMLRFLPPSQYQGRFTLRGAQLHGRVIPAGQRVILITGAACRDEREFDAPDRFDVTRVPERQVYFGHGHHVCLGKSLARLESRIAFEEILERFPDYRVVPESVRRTSSGNTQGMSRVDVLP